jgi:hypothetical protein
MKEVHSRARERDMWESWLARCVVNGKGSWRLEDLRTTQSTVSTLVCRDLQREEILPYPYSAYTLEERSRKHVSQHPG